MKTKALPAIGLAISLLTLGARAQETSIWKVQIEPYDDSKFKVRGSVFAIGDPVHETLTLYALRSAGLVTSNSRRDDAAVAEYVRGVFWNDDPCAQLFAENDLAPLQPSFGIAWYIDFRRARPAASAKVGFTNLACPLLGHSHFGELQFLHAMAEENCIEAALTAEKVVVWATLMYRVAIGDLPSDVPLRADRLGSLVSSRIGDLAPNDLLRAKTSTEVRQRALGSLLHVLQDSYAGGHVERSASGIERFLSYRDQDEDSHAHEDSWAKGETDLEKTLSVPGAREALDVSAKVLGMFRDKHKWEAVRDYLRRGPFALSPTAAKSGPGRFVKSSALTLGC